MTNRYAGSVLGVLQRLRLTEAGVGVVVVPAREQEEVAAALASAIRGGEASSRVSPREVHVSVLSVPLLDRSGAILVATGLPAERSVATAALTTLNGRRQWLSARGSLLIVLLSRGELAEFQRLAADVYATLSFLELIAFVPAATVDYAAARRQLTDWQRRRFGYLDLRGFIRAENEDVSWEIGALYQELRGEGVLLRRRDEPELEPGRSASSRAADGGAPLVEWLEAALATGSPQVVLLGHPGAGKTFFLRWLALRAGNEESLFGLAAPLPAVISLPAYAQGSLEIPIRDYLIDSWLEEGLDAAHWLDRMAGERRVIFLLDGLDEVGDERARRRVVEAVRLLRASTPGCLVVVTTRIAGYDESPLFGVHVLLAPFDEEDIRGFLTRWCELYAVQLRGESPDHRRTGRAEGARLAADVLGNPQVRQLATSPLLLSVLAIVHRAGVRLPDHRVELYSHATRVLVERWNQVRSLSGRSAATPLKAVDAVRLLGPIALRMARSPARAGIPEAELRSSLAEVLASGAVRGVESADEALELFRRSLGLLVEQAPGRYAFLHLTLGEYFAAWELVRSSALERLAADSREAYDSRWREVLLLAAGELGILRGDDVRLSTLVETLLAGAARRVGKPSPAVPSLLAGLLADDPGLSTESASGIVAELVPRWWFQRQYGKSWGRATAMQEARELVEGRIRHGRFRELVRGRLQATYGDGVPGEIGENLLGADPPLLTALLLLLDSIDVDYGPCLIQMADSDDPAWRAAALGWRTRGLASRGDDGETTVSVVVSRIADRAFREPARGVMIRGAGLPRSPRVVPLHRFELPWIDTTVEETGDPLRVRLSFRCGTVDFLLGVLVGLERLR